MDEATLKLLLSVILSGGLGKFVVDAMRKLTARLGLTLNKTLIRMTTLPVAYLVFFIVAKVTKQPFNQDLMNTIVVTAVTALASIGANETLKSTDPNK